jgi:hypothetical protein
VHYPEFFKCVSRTFLLTHARIRREPPAAPPPPRRSRRLLEKRLARPPEATSVPGDVGPASAEDDANAMFESSLDRSSLDSERSVAEDAEPAPPPTTLGDLPPELAAHVLSLAAPRCPLYRAVEDAVAEANARGAADLALAIETGNDGEAH